MAARFDEVRRRGLRTAILWLGGAIAVVTAAVSFSTRAIDPPEVPVAAVVRKDLSAWISSNGKVEPIAPQLVVARLDTFVHEVLVSEGAAVVPGQRLLTLEAAELRAQVARTQEEQMAAQERMRSEAAGGGDELARVDGDLQRTDAELVKLRRDRDALQRLVDKRAATRDELAQTTLALQQAEAEQQFLTRKRAILQQRAGADAQRARLAAERAHQTLLALDDQLKSTAVSSTIAGTVYRVAVRARQYVHTGDTLVEVADLHHVRVRAFIDEPDLGSIRPGQAVQITWDALTGRSWAGRTEQVPTSVVPRAGRSVGEVLCSVENDDMKLLPNINVDVRVQADARSNTLTVPRAAVRGTGEHRYVFVVRDRRLERRPITVGIAGTGEYEVLDGLSDGDLVALGGDTEPRDGMIVRSVAR